MFEKILNENTDSVMFRPLAYYKEPEFSGKIPMMIFTPTIINDERKLYVGAHPVSYLAKPQNRITHFFQPEIDGADIHYLLGNNSTDSILFTSVLRMNCTFPYILPNVHLPTTPEIEIMDAGIRDNYGTQTAAQNRYFHSVFFQTCIRDLFCKLHFRNCISARDKKGRLPLW